MTLQPSGPSTWTNAFSSVLRNLIFPSMLTIDVRLIKAPFKVEPTLNLSTLVEATFIGYAVQSPGLADEVISNDGSVSLMYNDATFGAGVAVVAQAIYGAALCNSGDAISNAIALMRFGSPMVVTAHNDNIIVHAPVITFRPVGGNGQSISGTH